MVSPKSDALPSHAVLPRSSSLAYTPGPPPETLASMLGRTTSLLPNAFMTSLGMPRDEDLSDIRHVSVPFPRPCPRPL